MMELMRVSIYLLLLYSTMSCNRTGLTINQILQEINLYQSSIFISDSIIEDQDFLKILTVSKLPNVISSFNVTNQLKSHSLMNIQDSLVLFYPSFFNEIKKFIDYLTRNSVKKFSSWKRPKCLVIYKKKFQRRYIYTIFEPLKYAWDDKFLDFSIIITNLSNSTIKSNLFSLNPFNSTILWLNVDDANI